jgi:hypothetical protein
LQVRKAPRMQTDRNGAQGYSKAYAALYLPRTRQSIRIDGVQIPASKGRVTSPVKKGFKSPMGLPPIRPFFGQIAKSKLSTPALRRGQYTRRHAARRIPRMAVRLRFYRGTPPQNRKRQKHTFPRFSFWRSSRAPRPGIRRACRERYARIGHYIYSEVLYYEKNNYQ